MRMTDPMAADGHHALKWLASDDGSVDRSFAAGLDSLRAQQRHLQQSLRDGFQSRTEVLEWCHAVDVVSGGQTPETWHEELVQDRWEVACLMADADDRVAICDQAPSDDETADAFRRRLIRKVLLPAFQDATELLRERVGEFSDEEGVKDAERIQYVAGRPRLHQRAVEQHGMLRWTLRDPPRVESEVMAWAEDIIHMTEGHVRSGFIEDVLDRHGDWWHSLTRGPSVRLEWLLASEIFPAMNSSLSELVTNSNELADVAGRAKEVPPG
ncbi:hypothetical protein BVU17_18175 (plasmid) [Haloarcula taiwanensis]|uniref:Uncharacterized protein n=1 Tax=Haloarcula taiwanensis TaxID=1932004 RepID=A0A2H5A468_9EURY|nr:hypothetical protein BVU17_18175 [Haloarcula taiwanensis]